MRNASLHFDGDDDYVDVGTLGNYGSQVNKGTIELWFRPTETLSVLQELMGVVSVNSGALLIAYECELDTLTFDIARDYDWTSYLTGKFTDVGLDDYNWHHLAFTFDIETNTVYCYIDGISIPADSTESEGDWADKLDYYGFYLGGVNLDDYLDCPTVGMMGDIRIWNVTRTQQQIQDNMYSRLIGNEPGLFAYWKINEGVGISLEDLAGTNDGTIYGATWTHIWWGSNPLPCYFRP